MSKELIVSTSPHELRVAITEDDQLVEIYIESESQHGLAGSIYKGRVTRVLPGMQSAFVNIGLSRDAFLYVSDFIEEADEIDGGAAADEAERKALAAAQVVERSEAAERPLREAPNENGRPEHQGERGPGRGRRGRRGRRRRGRREGFPDEKYADVGTGAGEIQRDREPPGQRAESPEVADQPLQRAPRPPARSFPVLPGESLAKYSGVSEEEEFEEPASAGAEGDSQQDNNSHGFSGPRPAEIEAETAGASSGGGKEEEGRFDSFTESWGPADASGEPPEGPFEPHSAPPESEASFDTREAKSAHQRDSQSESPENEIQTGNTGGAGGEIAASGEPSSEQAEQRSEADFESGDEKAENPRIPGPPEPLSEARVQGESGSSRYSRRRGRRGRRRRGRRREENAENAPAAAMAPALEEDEIDEVNEEVAILPAQTAASEVGGLPSSQTSIADLLKKGQEILVQIAKEPLGRKGARITSHIALPGRFLVYMPTIDHVGVSRKIGSDRERARLRRIVQSHRTGMPGGFIVRTAGESVSEEDIHGDMLFLYNLWLDIRQKAERKQAPALIHQDLDVVERVMRDQIGEDYKTIWVDGEDEYERILRFVERYQPGLVARVKLYTRSRPIFDEFNITADLERALRPKVWLKSGGYIVINPTEALVAIDVNTGKFVGKSDRLEDTIVKTNLEAAAEIVRQMRLRDLGGIIVVDFIDMDDRKNRHKVLQALEEAMRADRAPSKVLSFNEFGLLAITRKRVKQSLERALCTPCPYCSGSGYVKSPQTVVYEILAEAKKMSGADRRKDVTLRVNPEVARLLKSKENRYLQEIEEILHCNVVVRSDVALNRENFDIN